MAKMFYSVEEAARKLNIPVDEVRGMAESGRLQEFRDGDNLVFKVEQVNLLASENEDIDDEVLSLSDSGDDDLGGADVISIAGDSGEDSAIALDPVSDASGSGSAFALDPATGSSLGGDSSLSDSGMDSGQRSGVSIFDADELEEADPAAMTQVADAGAGEFSLDSVGSGSGLMDLTRESDDTSLGMDDLLDDFGAEDDSPTETVAEGDDGLFEAAEEESPSGLVGAGAASGAIAFAEPYDGAGSGLVGGFAFGAVLALALGTAVVIASIAGMPGGGIAGMLKDQFMIVLGVMAGAPVVFGALGFVLGKRGD